MNQEFELGPDSESYTYTVAAEEAGQRLDAFLASQPDLDLSRTRIRNLIDEDHVRVDGQPAKASQKLAVGTEIAVVVPPPQAVDLAPEEIPLDVIYEDSDIIVINKPRGLVVHPAVGHWSGTLVNALLERVDDLEGVGGELRPGIVHRLDKETTGVMVAAKNDLAHRGLVEQIAVREMSREYFALVLGEPQEEAGRVEAPIGRDPKNRQRMAVNLQNGKEAVTHFRVLERFRQYALLNCKLETGRTHQIRVHMNYIGYPVIGDPLYGPRKAHLGMTAQALHAHKLGLRHPRTGEWMEFHAPLPADFAAALETLRETRREVKG